MITPICIAALALGSVTPVASGAAGREAPSIAFSKFRLDNGLEVIVHEDRRAPVVAVDLWIHVGSGDEVPGKSGFAHLFEHMMFQGSKHVGEDKHMEILRGVGGSLMNGTTSFDRTNYFEVVPTHQLETALWLESDRFGFLLDHVGEASLANQRDVVRNERRQRVDNQPGGRTRTKLYQTMFPNHPYEHMVIGKHEDIEGAKLEDVHAFFKQWYVPRNATLVLAGDIDEPTAKTLAAKWFGDLPGGMRPMTKVPPPASLKENVVIEVPDPFTRLPELRWVWHAPARFAADATDLEIAGDVLGHRGWGRLYQRLVVEEQLAQSVGVGHDGMGFQGLFMVSVALKPASDRARVEKIVKEELLRFLDTGPTAAEVRRSTVDTTTALLFSLDQLIGKAEQLQTYNHFKNDPGYLAAYLREVDSRTPESVRLAARRWLAKPRALFVTLPSPTPSPTSAPGGAR